LPFGLAFALSHSSVFFSCILLDFIYFFFREQIKFIDPNDDDEREGERDEMRFEGNNIKDLVKSKKMRKSL
jgi:hypothetical protein